MLKYPYIFLVFLLPFAAFAQEKQLPIEPTSRLERIDADIARKLGLFTEYPGFQYAALFETAPNDYTLEIYYSQNDRTLRVKKRYDDDALARFQDDLRARLRKAPELTLNQQGRMYMMMGTTVVSLAWYAPSVVQDFDLNDSSAVAAFMFTGAAGILTPYFLTRNAQVSEAAGDFYVYGATRGVAAGAALYHALLGDTFRADSQRWWQMSSVLGSVGGAVSGYTLGNKMSLGKESILEVGGDFGLIWGFQAGYLLDDQPFRRTHGIALLAGAATGLSGAMWLDRDNSYSEGDAFVVRAAGNWGILSFITIADFFNPTSAKSYFAASLVGSAAAVGAGHYLVQNQNFTAFEGVMINLSELAGGLLGWGTGCIVSAQCGNEDHKLYLALGSVGSLAGFAIPYYLFQTNAVTPRVSFWDKRIDLRVNAPAIVAQAADGGLRANPQENFQRYPGVSYDHLPAEFGLARDIRLVELQFSVPIPAP